MQKPQVIVVGAGLAGLSCAVELVRQDVSVLVLEAEKQLGGRTSSWVQDGMPVESGLHRFLGFYEELPELIRRCEIELDTVIEWINEIEIRLPDGGPTGVFAISPLGKPLKTLATSLGNTEFLSATEKLAFTSFLLNGIDAYREDPLKLDKKSIVELAHEHPLPETVISRVITPLSSGLFFLPPEEYSAYVFFGTIVPYLDRLLSVGEGAFKGGMTEVMINPIADWIRRQGGMVVSGQRVSKMLVEDNQVIGVKVADLKHTAQQVVVATHLKAAQTLLKPFDTEETLQNFFALETMPAVTIQFELSEPSHTTDRVVFGPGTSLSCFAEQSRTTFPENPGRLSMILSPAETFLPMSDEEIFAQVTKEAPKLNLDLSTVQRYRVTRFASDFYSLRPGSEKLRPFQRTVIPGLTLAGDYTKQPYLATMEGAVVSGKLAAENVLRSLGSKM